MAADEQRWRAKQAHYQDPDVVARYDAERFASARGRASTGRKWRALRRGIGAEFDAIGSVLDVPCGTGRFTELLLGAAKQVVNADRSLPMLHASRAKTGSGRAASVQCDAEHLPFADRSFDLVLSVRFLFHVPRERRPAILRELGRVSRRFVVVDVRHTYSFATWSKRVRARLFGRRLPSARYTLAEIDADLEVAGLRLLRRLWIAPLFSEKMLLVCERDGET